MGITFLCNFHDAALPCNNVNMPPLPSGTGKYTTHGPHYAALRLHYLPTGLQYCPRASGPLAVLEALGQIMQTEGSIMWPGGGVFSLIPLAGVAYCTKIVRTYFMEAPCAVPCPQTASINRPYGADCPGIWRQN